MVKYTRENRVVKGHGHPRHKGGKKGRQTKSMRDGERL